MLNYCAGNSRIARFAVATLLLALPFPAVPADNSQAAGPVKVQYVDREKFTDVGDNGRVTTDGRRDALLAMLQRHVEERAALHVPPGGALTVSITDIDMAGDFEWWLGPRASHARVVKDVYPPRIKLDFRLADAGGAILAGGRRELTDLSFMTTVEYRNDLMRYEKKLIDDWLDREFRGAASRRAENR